LALVVVALVHKCHRHEVAVLAGAVHILPSVQSAYLAAARFITVLAH
jgi:hypothetical protein